MHLFTELIVLYPEADLPPEERFFPDFWKHPELEIEGNYYFNGAEGKWTELSISVPLVSEGRSTCMAYSYRKDNIYASGMAEIDDLKRYLNYYEEGRYAGEGLDEAESVAVTALIFDSPSLDHYRLFLETAAWFLGKMQGRLVNYSELLDEKEFRERFLDG